jgi:hypothetical protein
VQHKRTFFFLEQLILKHGADEACVNVKEMHEVGRGWRVVAGPLIQPPGRCAGLPAARRVASHQPR